MDIITLIFEGNLSAITSFGDEISNLYGLSDNKVIDDLKN